MPNVDNNSTLTPVEPEGLTVFVNQPRVPMDNNKGEQSIRNPVTGRKSFYGSGSILSARMAAFMYSIFQTLLLR